MRRYNPKEIEPKWQKIWVDNKIYEAEDSGAKPKKYVLEYFPYPSGAAMHVGHVRNYTIGDTMSRFARMRGYNVLHPMGWDAFGLPAENYAIKTGISPQETIKQSTTKFKKQLTQMGFGYDWSREFASSDPDYYKWTQWFFLFLYKRGLAYRKESLQWWCPIDKTVLANEQVENGKCWRCGSVVEKKALPQWFFKITDYADRLAADLEDLNWSEGIKSMQRNWIGRSQGAEIDFKADTDSNYVLLHGFGGDSKANFFPWTKERFEKTGARVYAPDLPNTEKPDAKEQAKFVLENAEFDKNTVLLGHSYGSVTAMRVLEQLDKPIKKFVIAAGFAEPSFLDHDRPAFEETTDWAFDFDKIKKNVGQVIILRDQSDHAVPPERADFLQEKLGGEIIDFTARESHACGEVEPVVLSNLADSVKVFTTRPDTLYGATFMVMAPEHPLVERITTDEQHGAVDSYVKQSQAKSDIERQETEREKTGVFTGAYAINPANNEKIPIWIADYVLYGYGTGAIMAVPAHDERDWEFAKKFELPITHVYDQEGVDPESCYHGEGIVKNSGSYDGMSTSDVREKIVADLEKQGVAEEKINYKIRDWLISRQRYWGAPIPMVHCQKCGTQPVPEDQLPVKLPEVESYEPSGDGRSPLARVPEFIDTTCPKCEGPAQRETDTMDGFACSSWYFLRFADPHNGDKAFDDTKAKYWLPVDDYIGGAEHAVMHLLYARFWTKVMYDDGLIDFQEPFKTLRNQGMILAPDGQKMSKSKGNTIEPEHLIEQGYGADAIRIMELFIGPWNQMANWSVEGMGGSYRFLQRVWTLTQEYLESPESDQSVDDIQIKRVMHRTIHRVSKDLEDMGFNTAIAALMETVNELYKLKTILTFEQAPQSWRWAIATLLQLLAPFAPHMTEELWHQIGNEESIHLSDWPVQDDKYLVEDTMTIVVQINGKVRSQLSVSADAAKEDVLAQAKADKKVAGYLQGKQPAREVYVPGKLVNFVV